MTMLATHDIPDILKFPVFHNSTPEPAYPTLREVYEKNFSGLQGERAQKTLNDYNTLLNDWERLTENKPVNTINRSLLAQFQLALKEELIQRGKNSPYIQRSPATVNKKFRFLRALVKHCFPRSETNPEAIGVLDFCQFPEPLTEIPRIPKTYTAKQVTALMWATRDRSLIWPNIQTALSWQTIIVCGWNFGARTYDLFDLKWSDIDFSYRNGMGSIQFVACKTSKLQRIPMHRMARSYLLKLKSNSQSDLVFPQFQRTNCSQIYKHWRRLLTAAGLSHDYHLEDFRKTANTRYETECHGVGQWVLGHSAQGVNARNYYDPTAKVLKAIQKHKQPKSFREILNLD